jgi:two-component system nitrate/nitrite sensor histidine kinase NarX
MKNNVKQSLISRSGVALAIVVLLFLVNMLLSFLIAESSENDGVRINLAGSLRMKSYRMGTIVVMQEEILSSNRKRIVLGEEIDEFEMVLHSPVLEHYIFNSGQENLQFSFLKVVEEWAGVKPKLIANSFDDLFLEIDEFVENINGLVSILELQTEEKFRLQRLVQGIFLLISVCIVLPVFYYVFSRVVEPLRAMVTMASRVRKGDFSARLDSTGDDEISELTETFNEMIESLDAIYHKLESSVEEKTRHLEKIQQGLRLLYEASRRLSSGGNLIRLLEVTLKHLERYLGVERIDIHMMREAQGHPFLVSSGLSSCVLLGWQEDVPEQSTNDLTFQLLRGGESYGILTLVSSDPVLLDKEQEELMAALVDTIVSSIAHEETIDQQQRLTLMEERTAISRELHDSLAQSLSYTKIQVSRFQLLREKSASTEELDGALSEIRTGIHFAYGQLREILATFRLQLNATGLLSSLEATAKEFSEKGHFNSQLKYDLGNFPLTPNEEVHVLQIVREALSNVVRHAKADSVQIVVGLHASGEVQICVADDGIGFSAQKSGPNHFGKTIMAERASILGGEVSFTNGEQGGAEVNLLFRSERIREQ